MISAKTEKKLSWLCLAAIIILAVLLPHTCSFADESPQNEYIHSAILE